MLRGSRGAKPCPPKDMAKKKAVNYPEYLQLDKILDAQKPLTGVEGEAVHDETLFIIVHQAYELWFKQILHEIASIQAMFATGEVSERQIGLATARIDRVLQIFKVLIEQIRIIETMTPLDFLDFRDVLTPASGFQSVQFRLLEARLGLRQEARADEAKNYHKALNPAEQAELRAALEQPSLFAATESWLESTPFLSFGDFAFSDAYETAVNRMFGQEFATLEQARELLADEEVETRRKMLEKDKRYILSFLDRAAYDERRAEGAVRLSFEAAQGALLIHLYRDEPILQQPHKLLTQLVALDDLLTTWRYRHAVMVLKMLGSKIGTGGSSGHDYLMKTVTQYRVFADFYNISSLFIPRKHLPELPAAVKASLGFHYTFGNKNDGAPK